MLDRRGRRHGLAETSVNEVPCFGEKDASVCSLVSYKQESTLRPTSSRCESGEDSLAKELCADAINRQRSHGSLKNVSAQRGTAFAGGHSLCRFP
jgi:hypothetical protein